MRYGVPGTEDPDEPELVRDESPPRWATSGAGLLPMDDGPQQRACHLHPLMAPLLVRVAVPCRVEYLRHQRRPDNDPGTTRGAAWPMGATKEALAVIPVGVRAALARAPLGSSCCRRAELATLMALRGHLHLAAGQVALVIALPTAAAAERLCWLVRALAPTTQVLLAPGHPPTPTTTPGPLLGWTVIARPATALAHQTGLLTRHGQPLLGLPAPVLHGQTCCAAAAWRAALLTIPGLSIIPGPTAASTTTWRNPDSVDGPGGMAVCCPNPVIGVALLGLARRLGARAQIDTRHGRDWAHLRTDRDISQLLTAVAGPDTAALFPPLPRRPRRPGPVGGGAANIRNALPPPRPPRSPPRSRSWAPTTPPSPPPCATLAGCAWPTPSCPWPRSPNSHSPH